MGFWKRLWGGSGDKKSAPSIDPHGIYLYARCDNCGAVVRVRADKQYDLLSAETGFVWHKTIVDSRCFRRMTTTVTFNRQYQVVQAEIQGGRYVTEADYQAYLQPTAALPPEDESESNPQA